MSHRRTHQTYLCVFSKVEWSIGWSGESDNNTNSCVPECPCNVAIDFLYWFCKWTIWCIQLAFYKVLQAYMAITIYYRLVRHYSPSACVTSRLRLSQLFDSLTLKEKKQHAHYLHYREESLCHPWWLHNRKHTWHCKEREKVKNKRRGQKTN